MICVEIASIKPYNLGTLQGYLEVEINDHNLVKENKMFDFLSMRNNYEERKVARYEGKNNLIIDTCAVSDSDQPYETGISYPKYNEGQWVIVELYDTIEEARKGHTKWVKSMTNKTLPKELKDVSTSSIAKLCYLLN